MVPHHLAATTGAKHSFRQRGLTKGIPGLWLLAPVLPGGCSLAGPPALGEPNQGSVFAHTKGGTHGHQQRALPCLSKEEGTGGQVTWLLVQTPGKGLSGLLCNEPKHKDSNTSPWSCGSKDGCALPIFQLPCFQLLQLSAGNCIQVLTTKEG